MSIHRSLSSVVYHQQDDETSCGAAAAQMVLDSIGAGLINQETLYPIIHEKSIKDGDWFSGPDGIEYIMGKRKPPGFPVSFIYTSNQSPEAISRKICWSIHHYQVAPIVLVYGRAHWLVVTGFTASQLPLSSDDTTYRIESFDLYDPAPPVPQENNQGQQLPPPHHDGGDGCGSGDDRGAISYVVPYEPIQGRSREKHWLSYYLTPAVDSGFWQGQYVVICDPDPAANIDVPESGFQPNGDLVTDPRKIVDRAREGLDAYGLTRREPWSAWLQEPLRGEAFLVEREDLRPRRFYYIVAFRRPSGEAPILANVSPYQSGAFAGSIAAPVGGTTHFTRMWDRDKVIERFAGRDVDVDGIQATLRRKDLDDHLVWRPCAESLSPFWPFYRFDAIGPGGKASAYVRIDGRLFTQLHVGNGM